MTELKITRQSCHADVPSRRWLPADGDYLQVGGTPAEAAGVICETGF
jgi:hypothetical protein